MWKSVPSALEISEEREAIRVWRISKESCPHCGADYHAGADPLAGVTVADAMRQFADKFAYDPWAMAVALLLVRNPAATDRELGDALGIGKTKANEARRRLAMQGEAAESLAATHHAHTKAQRGRRDREATARMPRTPDGLMRWRHNMLPPR